MIILLLMNKIVVHKYLIQLNGEKKNHQTGGSGEKIPSKDMNFFFQLSNLSQTVFSLENTTHWASKLQCAQFL